MGSWESRLVPCGAPCPHGGWSAALGCCGPPAPGAPARAAGPPGPESTPGARPQPGARLQSSLPRGVAATAPRGPDGRPTGAPTRHRGQGPPGSVACTACGVRCRSTGGPSPGHAPQPWRTSPRSPGVTGRASCTAPTGRFCRGPITTWNRAVVPIVPTSAGRRAGQSPRQRWCAVERPDEALLLPHDCGAARPGSVPPNTSTPGHASARHGPPDHRVGRCVVAFVAIRRPLLHSWRRTSLSAVCHPRKKPPPRRLTSCSTSSAASARS
jgi:hypothetical protein